MKRGGTGGGGGGGVKGRGTVRSSGSWRRTARNTGDRGLLAGGANRSREDVRACTEGRASVRGG